MVRKVDYRKILEHYRLDDPVLKQYFEKVSFEDAEYDREAQDYINDCALALGMEFVLRKRLKQKTLIIVNAGAPHLPLMGCLLKKRNYLPHFYIRDSPPSCTTNFLEFASKYSEIHVKSPLPAMMFDAHAVFDKKKALPSVKKLKNLGIEICMFLVEYNHRALNREYEEHPEFGDAAELYRKSGLDVRIIEVDPRPRKKDFQAIIDLLAEDEDFSSWFSSLLKTDRKECIKIMERGLKEFFD